jgi:hypothetical protein
MRQLANGIVDPPLGVLSHRPESIMVQCSLPFYHSYIQNKSQHRSQNRGHNMSRNGKENRSLLCESLVLAPSEGNALRRMPLGRSAKRKALVRKYSQDEDSRLEMLPGGGTREKSSGQEILQDEGPRLEMLLGGDSAEGDTPRTKALGVVSA